jgi:hypothetical protein
MDDYMEKVTDTRKSTQGRGKWHSKTGTFVRNNTV